jgi:sugar/nucleoside kinase (ribokinase family)
MGHAEYALTMIRPADQPFVLVAGAASRDITTADPRGWRLGGAVTYGSLTLARLGLRVGVIVGVDAEASRAHELDTIEAAGAIVIRVPLASGPVFEITERPDGRRLRCRSVSDPISGFSIPRAWLVQGTPAFLGPVAGELGPEWTAVGGGELALGWQGLLRSLRAGEDVVRTPPGPNPLLEVATVVGLSREDVEESVSMGDLAQFLKPGATLVRTDGERGGEVLVVPADATPGTRHYPAVRSDHIADPTGAGDVFLAAMLAARIDPSLGAEVPVAAAAASLAIEAAGIAAVPTRDAVRTRLRRADSLASR